MGTIENYRVRVERPLRTFTPEEAAAYWSKEAVAERERNAFGKYTDVVKGESNAPESRE